MVQLSSDQEAKLHKAKVKALALATMYDKVFSTPEGQRVLEDLCANFEPDFICQPKENVQTDITVRAAYRDVIEHIHRNMRVAKKHYHDEGEIK